MGAQIGACLIEQLSYRYLRGAMAFTGTAQQAVIQIVLCLLIPMLRSHDQLFD